MTCRTRCSKPFRRGSSSPSTAREAFSSPAKQLNPCIEINGPKLVLATQELAGVPVRILGPETANLDHLRNQIVAALDLLITGF